MGVNADVPLEAQSMNIVKKLVYPKYNPPIGEWTPRKIKTKSIQP